MTDSLSGTVRDPLGAAIVDGKATITDQSGRSWVAYTDLEGNYRFPSFAIPSGYYTLVIEKDGFSSFKQERVLLGSTPVIVNVVMEIWLDEQTVDIPDNESKPNISPDRNTDATVLRENELMNLPDDPEALEAALRALAGASIGPDGGEIYIDGFLSRNIPPKSSIREIRINSNPFSAEFDRIGYGRIEIITKIGSAELQGSAYFSFSDESLNARDTFALSHLPFQLRRYGGNLSDSFLRQRATYFLDIDRRELDDSAVVNATVLDDLLRIVPFRANTTNPQRSVNLSLRTDFQLNAKNTLSVRLGRWSNSNLNSNVGGLILPSQGFRSLADRNTIQLTQTSIIKEDLVNEFRFQYEHISRRQLGNDQAPAINVSESFIGGNALVGKTSSREQRLEAINNLTLVQTNHTTRFGGRIRTISVNDTSPNNFGGTVIFTGGMAPKLDDDGQIVIGNDGNPVMEIVSSIERYRRTRFFEQLGLPRSAIREHGGGMSQLSISGGSPFVKVSQTEVSVFVQDDWRVRQNLMLSLGLRMEAQTNIGRNVDLAPRASFAWSFQSGEKKKLTTVLRGGIGLFYSRVNEGLTLQALRYDGERIVEYRISDPNVLDGFDGIPGVGELAALGQQAAIRRMGIGNRPARGLHSAFNVEQQLPFASTLTATFSDFRVRNVFRSRNINAPLGLNLPRPNEELGDIYQFESTGRFESRRLRVAFSKRFGRNSFDLRYDLLSAKSDTDGAGSFPIDQYDVSGEFGRAATDIRHSLFASVFYVLPFNIRMSSMVIATSGRPFNITLGHDLNGDSLFTERPAFASTTDSPSVVATRWGRFDTNVQPGSTVIPRNFGTGSPYFTTSLSFSRTFRFRFARNDQNTTSSNPRRYSLTLSSQIWNVLNRSNLQNPIGNLTSPLFGKAVSVIGGYGQGDPLSGNRVIEFRGRFSF